MRWWDDDNNDGDGGNEGFGFFFDSPSILPFTTLHPLYTQNIINNNDNNNS